MPIPISPGAELATVRAELGQLRAAGDLDMATLRWALEYAEQLGACLDDQLALFLEFAADEWLEALELPFERHSRISELVPRC